MFPSSTSTQAPARPLRSALARQRTGLKKPRPLRSVSLQEPTISEKQETVTFERQISSGYPDSSESTICGDDCSGFSVCESISAMSAMIAGQAELEKEQEKGEQVYQNPEPVYQNPEPSFHRQDSNSSAYSYSSCVESESGSSYRMSRQNSNLSDDNDTDRNNNKPMTSAYDEPMRGMLQKSIHKTKTSHFDMNSNHISGNDNTCHGTSSNTQRSGGGEFSNVPLATLLTPSGEKIILTGKSMPTILNAAKILVREMRASIISLRVEDLNEEVQAPQDCQEETVDELQSCYNDNAVPPHSDAVQRISYSKEQLLSLSECDVCQQPPPNWNILIHTHSDCCVPGGQMKEYFKVINFRSHDGGLLRRPNRQMYENKWSIDSRLVI